MASSAPNNGSRLPLQKSLSRRVSFNEASLRRADGSDMESQTEGGRRRGFCGSICTSCCFWISLIIGLLLFVLILLGSIYYSYLKSNLPDVRLQRLDVNQIDVVSKNDDALLTADLVVHLNATNGNGKGELIYSSMTASLSSAGIDFGEFKLEDVTQPPHNTTALRVAVVVKSVAVEEAAANELEENAKTRMLVIDVEVRGRIDVLVGGKKTNGFPFKIECRKIDQSEIENGHAPKCRTQLTPIH